MAESFEAGAFRHGPLELAGPGMTAEALLTECLPWCGECERRGFETLRERLVRGPLSLDEIRTIGGEILEAIAAAHALGIIHRDIKSANVMLTASGLQRVGR